MVELTLKIRPTQTEVNRVMRDWSASTARPSDTDDFIPVGIFITDPRPEGHGGLTGHSGYD